MVFGAIRNWRKSSSPANRSESFCVQPLRDALMISGMSPIGLEGIVRKYYRRALRVTGQNGSGQNGTDKMVWTKWYWTKWYGQNGTILYFAYPLIQLNSILYL